MSKTNQQPISDVAKSDKKRVRLPKSLRKHFRRLKAEGREDEAAAMRKGAVSK